MLRIPKGFALTPSFAEAILKRDAPAGEEGFISKGLPVHSGGPFCLGRVWCALASRCGVDRMFRVNFKSLRNFFITGLLLLAPVGVTVFVIHFLIATLGGPTSRFFFFFVKDETLQRYPLMDVALVVVSAFLVVVLITLFGWFSTFLIGRFLMTWFEKRMAKVPLVRSVYMTVKQITDTFARSSQDTFHSTVMVEFPRKGVYTLGFMTGESRGEIRERAGDLVNVFVPTTPNPTSGFMLMLPRDEVIVLEMSVSDGMKAIISGGAVMPPAKKGPSAQSPEAK